MFYNFEDLEQISRQVIEASEGRTVWIFEGEMGAGKTTLIKTICGQLGVVGHIQSPTFSIVNEYQTETGAIIYHFDFYRLKAETEALDFGVEEYFDSGNICLLEWAEKVPSLLPENCFVIKIGISEGLTRDISF